MPARIQCPECGSAFAYSAALLGRMVRCYKCSHSFTVHLPEADAASAGPTPPPLPVLGGGDSWVPDAAGCDDPSEGPLRRRRPDHDRPTSTGTLIGILTVCFVGFFVLLAGVAYLVWPNPSRTTDAAAQGPPAPAPAPVAEEPQKNLKDILNDVPGRGAGNRPQGRAVDPELPIPPGFDPGLVPPGINMPLGPPFGRPRQPPRFPPVVARPAVAGGPKFDPIAPLPIEPIKMGGDKVEIALPGPAESAVAAGGGRLLLLHVPRANKVVVFDVSEGKIAKEIEASDPNTMLAGGMNRFVIYQPAKNVVDRWNCRTLAREVEVKSPFTDPVRALAMGSASNGPLVAAVDGNRRKGPRAATLAYYDPATMKEVGYNLDGQPNVFGIGHMNVPLTLRVSANGGVVTAGMASNLVGVETTVISGDRATRYWDQFGPRVLLPAPDGRFAGSFGNVYAPDRPPRLPGFPDASVLYVPAVGGDWCLAVRDTGQGFPGFPGSRPAAVEVYRTTNSERVVDLGPLDDVDYSRADKGRLDQDLFLVPEAKALVTIMAPKRHKLVVRRVELK